MKGATVASTGMTPNRQLIGGPGAGAHRLEREYRVSAQVLAMSPATRTWGASHAIKGNDPRPLVSQGGSTG